MSNVLGLIGLQGSLSDGINLSYNNSSSSSNFVASDSKVKTASGSNAMTSSDVTSNINSITNSAMNVADKVIQFQTLKAQAEASANAYKITAKTSADQVEIARCQTEQKAIEAQIATIDAQIRREESGNSVINTKTIVTGLVVVSVVAILGIVIYNSKKK